MIKIHERPPVGRKSLGRFFGLCLLCFDSLFFVMPASGEDGSAVVYTELEGRVLLQSELAGFEQYAESSMKSAHEILSLRNVPGEDLKRFEVWQGAQRALSRDALRQKNPMTALADAWVIGNSRLQPESSDVLPVSVRGMAQDLPGRLETRLVHIASRYLADDSVVALLKGIETFTTEQLVSKSAGLVTDVRKWTAPVFSGRVQGRSAINSVLQVPLMPGRAAKGGSDSGKALSGIRETTADAVQIACRLPESIRTQFQIAMNDLLEKRGEITELLSAVDSVSSNLRGAAESGHLSIAEIRGPVDPTRAAENPDGAEPFDIRDYGRAAPFVQYSASEVRALVAELREIAENKALSARLGALRDEADAVAQRAEQRAEKVVDHLAIRLVQVAVVCFFWVCVYSFPRWRMALITRRRRHIRDSRFESKAAADGRTL